jgi:transposase
MSKRTFYLVPQQYQWLAQALPTPVAKTKPPVTNEELLGGILFVLKTGSRWQDIPSTICPHDPSTCWRRLSFWRSRGALVGTWREVLGLLDRQGKVDLSLGALDGSLVQSPAFKDGTGYSGKHHRTGTNISLVTDKQGLPLANVLAKGNRHDLTNAEATIRKIRVGAKRRVGQLNADKGYDSRTFRTALRKRGIKANIPERVFKKRRKRGRKPSYDKATAKFRAFVERTNAWLKYFRKLRYRWERKKSMFQAFVDLACLLICMRRAGDMQ